MRLVHTGHCDTLYDIFEKYKEVFGSHFDELQFFTPQGGVVTGASLRDAKNGCELWERRGFDWICRCYGFDEQLRFVSTEGTALSHIDYRLTLGNGETQRGRTDAEGRTQRIKSKEAVQIEKAEFFTPKGLAPCCAKTAEGDEPARTVELKEAKTSEENYGSSVKTVTLANSSRPLTAGEIAMARLIFKDSIDYAKVRAHNHGYLPFQNENTAMTPNGEMYFSPKYFKEDFSADDDDYKIWFMHEMTHVWQYQLGYAVKWNGLKLSMGGGYNGGSAYHYAPANDVTKTLSDFNMEQQGDLISHYYAAKYLNHEKHATKLPFFERVLADFLRNPQNASLLPK